MKLSDLTPEQKWPWTCPHCKCSITEEAYESDPARYCSNCGQAAMVRRDAATCDQPTGTEAEVCRDIAARQALGLRKYGVSVADNPLSLREWLQHAYEETLDAAIYLKRAITELEKEGK